MADTNGMARMIADELSALLGAQCVLRDAATLTACRRDAWVLSELDELEGTPAPLPACVVRPRHVGDVVSVVNACRQSRTALVPAGLRSGVCGGVLAPEGSVVLDLSSLREVRSIDSHDLIGSFDAGVRGTDAEARCNEVGASLGHFPQSMALSSVGGWVATRAAGQFSTGYGNIEDMLLGLEAVMPDGSVVALGNSPRASTGPDLRHLLLGSEGTLGVITRVDLALRRLPEERACVAYYLPDMNMGFDAQRQVLQAGFEPVVLRQYDAREVGRLFSKFRKDNQCLLLVVHEGAREKVSMERQAVADRLLRLGGTPAPAEATEHWFSERNHVPTFKSFLESGVIVDTVEVAAPYSRIGQLYSRAIENLSKIEGIWNGSAHSSHAYRTGINLYFSFAVQPKQKRDLRAAYEHCWAAILQASLDAGGTISHHHGIGRVRRAWLERELGAPGLSVLRTVEGALDPAGIMNPGVLLAR
jgi:alkyldihydroxyacetonephosphate synthase